MTDKIVPNQTNDPPHTVIKSRREAAAYLGVSDRTFDRIQKVKAIALVRVGRRRKYLLRDLDAYLMSQRGV